MLEKEVSLGPIGQLVNMIVTCVNGNIGRQDNVHNIFNFI